MTSSRSFAKSLSVFAFAVLGLSLTLDAFAGATCRNNTTLARYCSTTTSCPTGYTRLSTSCAGYPTLGGSSTAIEHHEVVSKCTWEDFEGKWIAEPGVPGDETQPIAVTQIVDGSAGYARCSGWNKGAVPTTVPFPHADAPHGNGYFRFSIRYESTAAVVCEDANSGIGNNCGTFTDLQNRKHQPGDTTTATALRTCDDTTSPGNAILTYSFKCGVGVGVGGFLTLNEVIPGTTTPQPAPNFTGPCSPERVAAGACIMQLGGLPSKFVKQQGKLVEVVDTKACEAVFPGGVQVTNSLNSGQTQTVATGQLLLYTELFRGATCNDATGLPTVPVTDPPLATAQGTPTAAYGRYCHSDVGLFSDNTGSNLFPTDPTSGFYGTGEGFDNELRKCPVATAGGIKVYHTGDQDVERISLGNNSVAAAAQTNINVSCGGNSENDQGVFKVWIPDQADVLNTEIDISPLSDAPTLQGVAPQSATQNVFLSTGPFAGKFALELVYRRCSGGLADAIKASFPAGTSPVTLTLKGNTVGTATLLPLSFTSEISVGINW